MLKLKGGKGLELWLALSRVVTCGNEEAAAILMLCVSDDANEARAAHIDEALDVEEVCSLQEITHLRNRESLHECAVSCTKTCSDREKGLLVERKDTLQINVGVWSARRCLVKMEKLEHRRERLGRDVAKRNGHIILILL